MAQSAKSIYFSNPITVLSLRYFLFKIKAHPTRVEGALCDEKQQWEMRSLFRERTTAVPKFHTGTLKIIVGIQWGFCLGELGVLNINLTLGVKNRLFSIH